MFLEWVLTFYIAQMDSPKFVVRDRATQIVERIILCPLTDSKVIQPMLLKANGSIEQRMRCSRLLQLYRNIPIVHTWRLYPYEDWNAVSMEAFGEIRNQEPINWVGETNWKHEDINRAILIVAFKNGITRTQILKFVEERKQ